MKYRALKYDNLPAETICEVWKTLCDRFKEKSKKPLLLIPDPQGEYEMPDNVYGLCIPNKSGLPEIWIRFETFEQALKTFFHEFRHLKHIRMYESDLLKNHLIANWYEIDKVDKEIREKFEYDADVWADRMLEKFKNGAGELIIRCENEITMLKERGIYLY